MTIPNQPKGTNQEIDPDPVTLIIGLTSLCFAAAAYISRNEQQIEEERANRAVMRARCYSLKQSFNRFANLSENIEAFIHDYNLQNEEARLGDIRLQLSPLEYQDFHRLYQDLNYENRQITDAARLLSEMLTDDELQDAIESAKDSFRDLRFPSTYAEGIEMCNIFIRNFNGLLRRINERYDLNLDL